MQRPVATITCAGLLVSDAPSDKVAIHATTAFGFDTSDPAIELLATLGIVSLFLFAGLEVDWDQAFADIPPVD